MNSGVESAKIALVKLSVNFSVNFKATAFLFFSFCTSSFAQVPQNDLRIEKDFQSFQRNVYSVLSKPDSCIRCHGETPTDANADNAPVFIYADAEKTYLAVKSHLNGFSDLQNSELVKKGTQPNMMGPGMKDTLISALQKWKDEADRHSFMANQKVLPAQKIPHLPDDESFVTMTWELKEIDPALSGVQFTIGIQKMMGTYRLKDPTIQFLGKNIQSNQKAIEVKNLSVVINGSESSTANNYRDVDGVFVANESGSSVLSNAKQIIIDSNDFGNDTLTFAFQKLAVAPMPIQTESTKPFEIKTQNQKSKADFNLSQSI